MFISKIRRGFKVLLLAEREARKAGHNYVAREQILLGILREGTSVGWNFLKSEGVGLQCKGRSWNN